MLVVAGWYDTTLMASVQRTEAATFDITQTTIALPVGYLLIAAGVLVISLLARWADSRLVDVVYLVVGAFLTLLFSFVWTLAASVNGAPPVLPDPLASFISQAYTTTEIGPLNAVAIIGAGLLLVGVTSMVQVLRRRRTRTATATARTDAAGPRPVATQDVHA